MNTAYTHSRIYPFVFAIIGAVLGLIAAIIKVYASSRVPFSEVSVVAGLLGSIAYILFAFLAGGMGGLLLGLAIRKCSQGASLSLPQTVRYVADGLILS